MLGYVMVSQTHASSRKADRLIKINLHDRPRLPILSGIPSPLLTRPQAARDAITMWRLATMLEARHDIVLA